MEWEDSLIKVTNAYKERDSAFVEMHDSYSRAVSVIPKECLFDVASMEEVKKIIKKAEEQQKRRATVRPEDTVKFQMDEDLWSDVIPLAMKHDLMKMMQHYEGAGKIVVLLGKKSGRVLAAIDENGEVYLDSHSEGTGRLRGFAAFGVITPRNATLLAQDVGAYLTSADEAYTYLMFHLIRYLNPKVPVKK